MCHTAKEFGNPGSECALIVSIPFQITMGCYLGQVMIFTRVPIHLMESTIHAIIQVSPLSLATTTDTNFSPSTCAYEYPAHVQ
mmetsp:Transcript_26077/g.47989  ORF Transcript_26077/g.47989 Transcript_26077/m.47989 type:complete len:83 (-) Transcript_26077:1314-1562(-)